MQRYIRLAGIEVDGATDAISFLPQPNEEETSIDAVAVIDEMRTNP